MKIIFEPLKYKHLGWCDACCPDQTRKVILEWRLITNNYKVLLLCNDCYQYFKNHQDKIKAGEVELMTLLSRRLNMRHKKQKKEKEKMPERIKFSEIKQQQFNSIGGLTDLEGETLIIKDVEFLENLGNLGEVAIVTVERENGKIERRHTFSKVLIKQLQLVQQHLKQGKEVVAGLVKQKRYYTFE